LAKASLQLLVAFLFGIDRTPLGMAKPASQYVAEFTANLASHLVTLTAVIGRNHYVQQVVPSVGDSLSNHFQCLGINQHKLHLITIRTS
jgi:hypothetical protein